jgi:ABC-2 type transport system ATP-binding protein
MPPAIHTHDLTRRFKRLTAVDHLNLRVEQGEIYAFLGLNGAGKTTTIRLLLGMLHPTGGKATVLGKEIRPGGEKPWAKVGCLVETADAYPQLTVRENLEVVRRYHLGVPPRAVSEVIERLGLSAYADRHAGTLSHGNLQRLGTAKALLHQPRLLILDEPSLGLDPRGIVEIRDLLLELAHKQGVTVFMSSHILAEVSRLAGRVGILHNGRLLQELDVEALERSRRKRLVLRARDSRAALKLLEEAGFTPQLAADGALEILEPSAFERPDDIAALLVRGGAAPTHLALEQEDLEAYFLRLVGMDAGGEN